MFTSTVFPLPTVPALSDSEKIARLDLSKISQKLQLPAPEGKGWTAEQAEEGIKWYRRFLEVCKAHPMEAIVPNGPIDEVWHAHILDTKAYREDCDLIFGHPLDHYPYFGLNGPEDEADRDNAFVCTNKFYTYHYGEDCTQMRTFHAHKGTNCDKSDGDSFPTCREEMMSGLGPEKSEQFEGEGSSCSQFDVRAGHDGVFLAQGCNGAGSGTGCGQRCGRK